MYEKIKGNRRILYNKNLIKPRTSFYSLSVELINGKKIDFQSLKGKKVMIVNTASNCGYTAQYAELQKLYHHSKEDLEIIAFPSNDFKRQEEGDEKQIENFCTRYFSTRFLFTKKYLVRKSEEQHSVFYWLTHKDENGWNDQGPTWNFSKYLVDEDGMLTHYFDPAISPVSGEVIKAVHS